MANIQINCSGKNRLLWQILDFLQQIACCEWKIYVFGFFKRIKISIFLYLSCRLYNDLVPVHKRVCYWRDYYILHAPMRSRKSLTVASVLIIWYYFWQTTLYRRCLALINKKLLVWLFLTSSFGRMSADIPHNVISSFTSTVFTYYGNAINLK